MSHAIITVVSAHLASKRASGGLAGPRGCAADYVHAAIAPHCSAGRPLQHLHAHNSCTLMAFAAPGAQQSMCNSGSKAPGLVPLTPAAVQERASAKEEAKHLRTSAELT